MLRRNGNMPKVIAGVVAFFLVVYLVYSLHDLSGQLKNTERTAERYRREQESVSAQLQEMTNQKQDLKSTCDHDKEQLKKSLTALQNQHKMLSSQHEDLQTEYSKLNNENEKAIEMHKKEDEGKESEYRLFKQNKELEISSLRDKTVDLEREKTGLTQEVDHLKAQLQNALDLLQQAQERQKQIEQQFLQQQQQQLAQQLVGQQALKQGLGSQQGLNQGGLAPNNQQGFGVFGDQKWDPFNKVPVVEGANLNQGQGQVNQRGQVFKDGFQAMQQNQDGQAENTGLKKGGVLDAMLESLKPKPKPVDHNLLEEQQQQHQVIPPKKMDEKEDSYISRGKHGSQGKPGPEQDKHKNDYPEQHQINKPDLHPREPRNDHQGNQGHDHVDGAGNHDNRIENQGPVNLQVQEPRLPPADDGQSPVKDEALRFHAPEKVDDQIPPQDGLDDTHRQEQMQIPARHNIQDPNEANNENDLGEMEEEDANKKSSAAWQKHDTISKFTKKPVNNGAKSVNLKKTYKPVYNGVQTGFTDKTKKPVYGAPKLMQSLRRV